MKTTFSLLFAMTLSVFGQGITYQRPQPWIPLTSGAILYGDTAQSNAMFYGPSGLVTSNANGYLSYAGGSGIVASNSQFGGSMVYSNGALNLKTPNSILQVAVFNTNQLVIHTNGYVGIGTNLPSALLHLQTPAGVGLNLNLRSGHSASSSTTSINFQDANGVNRWQIGQNQLIGDPLEFNTYLGNKMTLTSGGLLGIGTKYPSTNLSVNGETTTTSLNVTNNAVVSGNLGVGMTPIAKADINGQLRVVGFAAPGSGQGLEFGYSTPNGGYIIPYNRDTTAYNYLNIDALDIRLNSSANTGNVGIKNASPTVALDVTGGGKFSAAVTTTSTTTNAPGNTEFVTAGWVRNAFGGFGTSWYASTNVSATTTNAEYANGTNFTFTSTIPTYDKRTYTAPANGTYFGSVVTTQRFLEINAGITVNSYLEALSGSGTTGPQVKPEIYVSYDGTNWQGDWNGSTQYIPEGGTNLYSWVVSNPYYTSTNATGFFVERRFKMVTQTTPAASDIVFHLGTNYQSHITLSASTALSGNAYLAANQTWTGTNNFSGGLATPVINMTSNYVAADFVPIDGHGRLAISNNVLYFITTTKTNLISDGN